jgi:hypothetical protein
MDVTTAWSIELESADRTARLAAAELQAHLARLGGPELPITAEATGPRIALRHGPAGDGFVRAPDQAGLTLRGEGPRGLLFAVYDLLEALGCRWPAPGQARLPRRSGVRLPAEGLADRPAFPRRSLVIGHDHFLDEAESWIIWAARNRLNTIFIHTTIHEPALGACRLGTWRKRRRALLPLIRERGLNLELGGHHLRDLLPRRLFNLEPELFRHNGERRAPDHNFCVSSERALERVRRTAAAFYAAYPETDVYHLWPDDLRAGGWCRCPRCAALSPADQALIAANALAEALPPQRQCRVAHLAYHDTEEAPGLVAPHPAVAPLFAPRLRSYAEGLGGPANQGVAGRLARCAARFADTDTGRPAPLAIFEYYLDGILFKSAPPPLPATIAADLRAYRAAGAATIHGLLTGDRPFAHGPVNAFLFARLAWNPERDPVALLADYAAARAPRAAAQLARAYAELEAAWLPALARDPEADHVAIRIRGRDPVMQPPLDVLDAIIAPHREAERRLERMGAAEDAIERGRGAWEAVLAAEGRAAAALEAERAEWELGAALLRFLQMRQQLYVLASRGAPRPRLLEALIEAQQALDALTGWAAANVPARARAGHALLRAPFQLQLDHIADRFLLAPWGRLGLRARRAGDLARILPRLIR